jgi:hypothetical protein
MDFREGQLVKTSTNRLGRSTILTLSEPCRRSGAFCSRGTWVPRQKDKTYRG